MNLKLGLASFWIPPFIKKRALEDLNRLTAEAFGEKSASLQKGPYAGKLESYARSTRRAAEAVLERGVDLEAVKSRLRGNALAMGKKLREEFGVRNRAQGFILLKVLYRAIGIDLAEAEGGEILMRGCFFSRFYTPPVCGIISALDEGMMAGILGDGRLEFSERITEGNPACRARFIVREGNP